jgi:predicted 2-oxoglutarate/Fe(II)-dependent dioxygenase YbiX
MYHLFTRKIQKAIAQGYIFSGIPYTTKGQNAYAIPGTFLKPAFLRYQNNKFYRISKIAGVTVTAE